MVYKHMGWDFRILLFLRQTSSEWQCEIKNSPLVEWRKDTAGWYAETQEGWTQPYLMRNPTCPQHTFARSALCGQFLLFPFISVSMSLISELASDSFGKNSLEMVYSLSALSLSHSVPERPWSDVVLKSEYQAHARVCCFGGEMGTVKDFVAST